MLGPGVFGDKFRALDDTSNRELLLELCQGLEAVLANTLFDIAPEKLVTYRNFGVAALGPVSSSHFAQLDHILAPSAYAGSVVAVFSDRTAALRSQHFCLIMDLAIEIPKSSSRIPSSRPDISCLSDGAMRREFSNRFVELLPNNFQVGIPLDDMAETVKTAMLSACDVLPRRAATAHRPWIGSRTLLLIEYRNAARAAGSAEQETLLNRRIRQSAKADRTLWLNNLLAKGDWNAIRKLRKSKTNKCGRLRNLQGDLVPSDCRIETMGEYLAKIQWSVQFASLEPAAHELYDEPLQITESLFSWNFAEYWST